MGSNKTTLWPARDEELRALCADPTLTFHVIGKRMGVTSDQAHGRARKMGFRAPKVGKVRAEQQDRAREAGQRTFMQKGDHGWPWTEELVETLKALLVEKLTNAQIAERIGHGQTGASISKKVSRLKLSSLRAPPVDRNAVRVAARRQPARPFVFGDRPQTPTTPAPLPPEPEHLGEVVPLEGLRLNSCRWPIGSPGDPAFGFCGCQKRPDGPYCQAHHRRAYAGKPVRPSRAQSEPAHHRRAHERFA